MGRRVSNLFDQPNDVISFELSDCKGLRQTWITFKSALNQAERTNVFAGVAWARLSPRRDLLSQNRLRERHRRLFGDVQGMGGIT